MGFFSKVFDDVLGLDPNGGGIYSAARDVLGDTVADDWLGMDPNGGGAIKAWNVALPVLAGYGLYSGFGGMSGLGGSGGAALGNGAFLGEGIASGIPAWDAAAGIGSLGTSGLSAMRLGELAGYATNGSLPSSAAVAGGLDLASSAGSWLSQLASGLTGNGGGTGGAGALGGYGSLISQLLNVGSGIYGMKLAGDAREASDPFAQYRPGYGAALVNLEANPSQIQTRPGFQAGLEAITRNTAGKGYLGSGNEAAALMRYSGDFYNQEASRLAQLAGAGQTPGAGQFGAADLASKSLGSIGYGLAPQTQPNSNQLLQLALTQLMRP